MFDLQVYTKINDKEQELMGSSALPQNFPTFPFDQEATSITSIQEQFGGQLEQLIYSTFVLS